MLGKNTCLSAHLRVVFSWRALCATPSMVIQLGGIGRHTFVYVALAYSYICHNLQQCHQAASLLLDNIDSSASVRNGYLSSMKSVFSCKKH